MKLVYHKSRGGNFGDDLNEWLWSELLGADFFDGDERELFYGIGTIISRSSISRSSISRSIPRESRKIIFGSGAARESPLHLDGTFDVRCVRGPLTARALRLPPELAITDPACLVVETDFGRLEVGKEHGVSLVPHHLSLGMLDWESASALSGMRLIDPTGPYLSVMEEIRKSRIVVTESLHGAIIADAFRIPWVAIRYGHRFLEFKWRDWAESMRIDLSIVELPFAFHGTLTASMRVKNLLRRVFAGLLRKTRWSRLPYRRSSEEEIAGFIRALSRVPVEARPSLSRDGELRAALGRLGEAMDALRSEHAG